MPDNAAPVQHGGAPQGGQAPVDVHALAEKVYALMLKEVRVGHARTESTAAPKRFLED